LRGSATVKDQLENEKDVHVLVTILTDGLENASQEYTGKQINKLIKQLKTQGWTFTFIGADFDVKRVARDIRIANYYCFEKSAEGVSNLFDKEVAARKKYMKRISLGEDLSSDYFE